VLSIKENEKIKRAPRGVYRDLIIDIVYTSGCITLTRLVEIIAEKLNKPKKTVYNSVAHMLVKLVKQKVIERRMPGVYCKPRLNK